MENTNQAIYVAYEDHGLSAVLKGTWKDCLELLTYAVASYKETLREDNKGAADEISLLIESAVFSTASMESFEKVFEFEDDNYAKISYGSTGLTFQFETLGPSHEYWIAPVKQLSSVAELLASKREGENEYSNRL